MKFIWLLKNTSNSIWLLRHFDCINTLSVTPHVISVSQQSPHIATITLSQPTPTGGLPIDYIFGDKHTSLLGEDYILDLDASENIANVVVAPDGKGGVLTIAEGVTTATVVVLPLVDDDTDEEVLNVEFTGAEGYDIDSDKNEFSVKIVDDLPVITLSGTPQVISESQQTPQIATITLSQPTPTGKIDMDWKLVDNNSNRII